MKYLKRLFKRAPQLKVGETIWLQYWPKHKPNPEGWRTVVRFGGHEHLWRAKIVRKD